jgi:hypothetical protein
MNLNKTVKLEIMMVPSQQIENHGPKIGEGWAQ